MILIVAEHNAAGLSRSTAELVTASLSLDDSGDTAILLLGSNLTAAADEAAALVPQVLVADLPELAQYDAMRWSAAVAQICEEGGFTHVLVAASKAGREFGPRTAVRLGAALLENAVSIHHSEGELIAERYAYLSRVRQKVSTRARRVVLSIQRGAFPAAVSMASPGEQLDVQLDLPDSPVRITARELEKPHRVPLAEAEIVVSGGRGVGSCEGFRTCVESLADELGAAVGATRAVVDAGWRPYAEQVGQTGKTVQPKVYLAIGISGAVQHLSGMNKSKHIIAINRDANAPIFQVADLGIIGDATNIVPEVLRQLDQQNG